MKYIFYFLSYAFPSDILLFYSLFDTANDTLGGSIYVHN